MPSLSIAEFPGNLTSGAPIALKLPPLAEQLISFADGEKPSDPFTNATTLVRLLADAPCAVFAGMGGSLTKSMRLAVGVPEVFTVTAGSTLTVIPAPEAPPAATAQPPAAPAQHAAAPKHRNIAARQKPVHKRRGR